ncbi:MAG TPA: hypothetical protein VG325_10060 [Solirubrobacteraceae bacterium]|jgi:hypothetical protein|nr:hypothetical protein [Solirubrobacteraceae bacterium]
MSRAGKVLAAAAVSVVLAGCGSASELLRVGSGQAPPPPSAGVPPAEVSVIRGWSEALRAGHVAAAARYFRFPSVFFAGNGPPIQLRSLGQVETAMARLPCGARFLSAQRYGPYVNVLFRLTNRPGAGAGCGSGTGQTARTNFLIRNGRIVQWLRAPDEPGDNGTAPASPSPTGPGTTPGGGQPVV